MMHQLQIDQHIYKGSPSDPSGRLPKEMRAYAFLDRLGIPYERADHEAAMTIEACRGVDELLGIRICKNLFLCNRTKTEFYLLLMPGEKPFKTKELSSQIGCSRLSFAPAEYMEELLDLTPGSATILGLINDRDMRVRLLIDQDLLSEPFFGCHPCINTSSVKLRTADLLEKIIPGTGHIPTFVVLTGEA